MSLLVVLPLTVKTLPAATELLTRAAQFERFAAHTLLVVREHGLTEDQCKDFLKLAESVFGSGEAIRTAFQLANAEYPFGYNFLFESALRHIITTSKFSVPFLWLDPHCVPMRKGWLYEIEREFAASKKSFLGQLLTPERHGTPYPILSSVAVYTAPLPKPAFQRLVAKRAVAWETTCADLLVPNAHYSQLIHTVPFTGTVPIYSPDGTPGTQPISSLPSAACLVHTAGSKSLHAALRGDPVEAPPPAPEPVKTPENRAAYYHSGNLGDVIYALAAIRLAGGGKLLLGPKQRKTSPAGNPIKSGAYAMLAPLLDVQPYVTKHAFVERHPGTDAALDLNTFRNSWDDVELRTRTRINTLVRMHCHILGVDPQFRQNVPWLTVPHPINTPYFVFHRSARYRDPDYPWAAVLRHFEGRLLFVGLPEEYREVRDVFKIKLGYWQPRDFLELASVIAGAKGFVGNQSFPCAIALGLGQRVLQEAWPTSPDCTFVRKNFLSQLQPGFRPDTDALTTWETSGL